MPSHGEGDEMMMTHLQPAGPPPDRLRTASHKYDLLTALSLIAFQRGGGLQVSVLRLIALITARYNWRLDELCVCQRDMARFWGVTERTAKREVRAWIDARLMVRTRVGVRGRAGAYRLDMIEIWAQARSLWERIGPDYVERMGGPLPDAPSVQQVEPEAEDARMRGTWRAVSRRLRLSDPASHQAWIAPLIVSDVGAARIEVQAPSRFAAHYIRTHLSAALEEAVEAELGPGRTVVVSYPGDNR